MTTTKTPAEQKPNSGKKKAGKKSGAPSKSAPETRPSLSGKQYEKELAHLQVELVKLQEWIRSQGLKVVVIFEGRDAAGKGGTIKRITESLSPRVCRVEALPAAHRTGADPVVLPALCRLSSFGRRDGPLRSQLVQPGRGRAGHGLLLRRGVSRSSCVRVPSSNACWCDPGSS